MERRRPPTVIEFTPGEDFFVPISLVFPEETGPDNGSVTRTPRVPGYKHRVTGLDLDVWPPAETGTVLTMEISPGGNRPFTARYTTPELTIPPGNGGLSYTPEGEIVFEAGGMFRFNFIQIGGEEKGANSRLSGHLYLSPVVAP